MTQQVTRQDALELAKEFYGHDLKPAQADIMALVYDMSLPRVSILGATQIQKSRAAARAIGLLALYGKKVTIVGPKAEQAITPLQYFIDMLGYNPVFEKLMLQGGEKKVERLQASEAKDFVSFKSGGFIKALTLNEKDSQDKKVSTLGKGSEIIVFEEASLTSNDTESLVLRMIAGWPHGRMIKLGNAITREDDHDHFYRSTLGEDGYVSLTVDYKRAVEEGIYMQGFIDEARKRPFFPQFYECKFPEPSGLVKGGYTRLFRIEDIVTARSEKPFTKDRPRIGIDIGQGKPDKTSVVARWPNYAERVYESSNEDIMAQIGEYIGIIKQLNPSGVYVDGTGLGAGIAPRLRELEVPAFSIIAGATPKKDGKPILGFSNTKAYAYHESHNWLTNLNGKLGEGDWNQLTEVAFKVTSDKNMIIESKDELKERGIASYNDAEAFMLTFASSDYVGTFEGYNISRPSPIPHVRY